MHDTENQRVFIFDAVHNHVFAHSQPAVAWTEVFLSRPSDVGKAGKREETIRDGVRSPSARGARDAPSAGRREFRKKAGATAFLHFAGKLLHGLPCDNAAFATGKGRAGVVDREQELGALALPVFP